MRGILARLFSSSSFPSCTHSFILKRSISTELHYCITPLLLCVTQPMFWVEAAAAAADSATSWRSICGWSLLLCTVVEPQQQQSQTLSLVRPVLVLPVSGGSVFFFFIFCFHPLISAAAATAAVVWCPHTATKNEYTHSSLNGSDPKMKMKTKTPKRRSWQTCELILATAKSAKSLSLAVDTSKQFDSLLKKVEL